MPTFTLDGETYEYLRPDPGRESEDARSWAYGEYPRVLATLPLADGSTVRVHAVAAPWISDPTYVFVVWADDDVGAHWAWIPAGNVECLNEADLAEED
ncbi:MAG: hypothetical protein ABWY04_17990 [Arthrobacter sp.]|jgi:hypothetical protein